MFGWVPDKLKSRKLWAAFLCAVFVAGNKVFGFGLSDDVINWVSGIAMAYIGGQGMVDAVVASKKTVDAVTGGSPKDGE